MSKVITIGDINLAAGYYKFKVKAATGRNESSVVSSPAFNALPTSDYSYPLTENARTSAGIYSTDGTLVRTLWSGEPKIVGDYDVLWDGTGDDLQPLPVAEYTFKLLSNNVVYEWQGVMGNTSLNQTGADIHRSLNPPIGMVITGSKLTYIAGYGEGTAAHFQFTLTTPQIKLDPFPYATNQITNYVATDGTNIYFTGVSNYNDDANGLHANRSFVYATKVSDNTPVTFSSGQAFQVIYGNSYTSAIDVTNGGNEAANTAAVPTGIAVSDNYIYVSHAGLNRIHVLNKSTGAAVTTLSFTAPRLITSDGSNLWVSYNGATVQKFPINSDGTLGTATIVLSGISDVADMKVNGTTLVIADGGTKQQIRFFNNTTGVEVTAFGQLGGNKTSPVIANDRFAFWVMDGNGHKTTYGGIAFASDGSFWVADSGNCRMNHYAADKSFIETVAYVGANYTLTVDPNNHARVINGLEEYQVDYTSSIKSSWVQKYNWAGAWPDGKSSADGLKFMATLSNGRTYAIAGQTELVELDTTTGVRFTGQVFPIGVKIYPNGDIYRVEDRGVGFTQDFQKYALSGFSGNNPTYSSVIVVATNSHTTPNDPRLSGAKIYPHELTSDGYIVNFRGTRTDGETNGFHLAALNPATGNYVWKTAQSTDIDYSGEFPSNGDFDIGNGSWYQANAALAIERNIFWNFTGEAWKGGQTNKWNQVYDNGLFIGQFGITSYDYDQSITVSPAMMAGNAYGTAVVKEGSNYFIYHNDESHHGGFHRWKVSGLDSIHDISVPLTTSFVRGSEAIATEGVDLMAGLPFKSTLATAAGWTRTPNSETANWSAKTSVFTYQKRKPYDIYASYKETTAGTNTISRSLGSNTNLSAWNLAGRLTYNNCDANTPDFTGLNQFLDILDNTGKIIVRFYQQINYDDNFNITVFANSAAIVKKPAINMKFLTKTLQPLSFSRAGSNITVNFAGQSPVTVGVFEVGANVANPTTMRLLYTSTGGGFAQTTGISDFTFTTS